MIAYFISHRYQKVPLFDFLARQDGFFLPSIEELREQNALRVEDAMQPGEGSVWRDQDVGKPLQSGAQSSPATSFLLWRRGNDWQIVSRDDVRRRTEAVRAGSSAPEIPSRGPLPQLYPDQHLDEALRLIGDWPIVPVVNRANIDKLEGVLSLEDILRAYRNS